MSKIKERSTGIRRHQWLAIEGADAVGKTKLAQELFMWLKNKYPEINPFLMKEFSFSPIGRLIQEIINDKTFFMLENNKHIPIAETLVLGSDFIFQQEEIAKKDRADRKSVIVSDRGIYSFFVYQGIRLKNVYGNTIDWYKWIENIFLPIGIPNLTLCLSSPLDQIERRLNERGDKVTPESLDFIDQAQREFLRLGGQRGSKSFIVLENINGKFDEILNRAQNVVKEILIPYCF
ncbi:hypothetical protein GW944_00595 [Candidatus Parcubacteria bacterium]|nr:hypothetical protein [Candidatus Parcubacteria bacterium]